MAEAGTKPTSFVFLKQTLKRCSQIIQKGRLVTSTQRSAAVAACPPRRPAGAAVPSRPVSFSSPSPRLHESRTLPRTPPAPGPAAPAPPLRHLAAGREEKENEMQKKKPQETRKVRRTTPGVEAASSEKRPAGRSCPGATRRFPDSQGSSASQ